MNTYVTATTGLQDLTVSGLFEEQVKRTPDAIALLFKNKELCYKELNERSNQLCDYLLQRYEIRPNDLIGIKLPRNEWLVIAILAVLKSGGAYVPIDPEYPKERVDYIIADSNCKILVDTAELEKFKAEQHQFNVSDPEKRSNSLHLAYVIYTSGSTGIPKGVLVTHGNLNHFLSHVNNHCHWSSPVTQPFLASSSFDISVFQLFAPLLSGGTSVLVDKEMLLDLDQFTEILKQVTVLDTVPGVFNLIVHYIVTHNLSNAFGHVERIFIGGDKIPDNLLHRLSVVFNAAIITVTYGPTEGTVFCTCRDYKPGTIGPETKGSIIGAPIHGTQIYILDEQQHLASVGVEGEIYIGGNGLAAGYLNQPQLTAEKFVVHPFPEGQRIYKSGDVGRWLPDGNIEFIGRKDTQVKIQGYRVELGEIESVLQDHPDINDTVVVTRLNNEGETEMIAYVVAKTPLNSSTLRTHVSSRLPAFMIPSNFVQLPAIPLTPNGKIDKNALPGPKDTGMATDVAYVAPGNETERKLVLIWEKILNRKEIGVNDNFFDLGGNSMKIIKMIALVNKTFDIKLAVITAFTSPNISTLSKCIYSDDKKKILVSDEELKVSMGVVSETLRAIKNHNNES